MTCANCGTDLPDTAPVQGLVVCSVCLRTLIASTGALATAEQTVPLVKHERDALVAQRKAIRKAKA